MTVRANLQIGWPETAAIRSVGRLGAALLGTRWLVRLPILVYRARMGWLFGQRFLLLEHVGRTTGRRRLVVLEVIARLNGQRFVVMSGRGAHAQWLRNVRTDPHVRIDIGGCRGVPAVARELDPAESVVTLDRYARDHPRTWPIVRELLARTCGVDAGTKQETPPVVEFRLRR